MLQILNANNLNLTRKIYKITLKKKTVGFGFEFRRWRGSFRFHNKWRVVSAWLVKFTITFSV